MKRRELFRRLARIEKTVVIVESVTAEMLMDWRADGMPESEVMSRSLASMMTGRLPCTLREDSIYEMQIRLHGHWAPQHPDIFIRLVGQLMKGQINISIDTEDLTSRRCFPCRPELLGEIDPIALVFLAEATWDPDTWTSYWQFRQGGQEGTILRYYFETGLLRARKFEEDRGIDVAESKRAMVRADIARIRKVDAEFPEDEIPSYGDDETVFASSTSGS